MTFKQTVLITVGLSWIGIASMYLPPAINFLLLITIGIPFNQFFYLSIYGFAPLTVFFWVISIVYILNVGKQKKILLIGLTLIYCIIFMSIYYYLLFTDPSLIGTFVDPFIVNFTLFSRLYFILGLSLFVVSGLIFVKESLKSDNLETILKAKFLLAALISFAIGAILTSSFPEILIKVIARMILVSSSLELYVGFLLPKKIKKLFLNVE
ncbi:MAG: hypothetical protein ACFFAO_18120 [Candidatus Hermodarchaeota archaeon]